MLNRILLAWMLLCAVCIALYIAASRAPQPPQALSPVITPVAPLSAPEPLATAENLLKRPLFWPSRRAHATAEEIGTTATLDGIVLLGLAGNDKQALAILRKDNKIIRLRVGEFIDGWRFGGARYNGAAFVRDGEVRVIKIPRIDINDLLAPPPNSLIVPSKIRPES